ncbi:MAG: DeoR/GlpR transcriptional regulator [Clostridia bacterium]|nr:DeoR/GlpR transcriptional regulator [Clostridia bacterium]
MLAQERQNRILEILREKDAVSTAALTELFGVSVETVRRDLLDMERENRLRRVHGGAVRVESEMKGFTHLSQRSQENTEKKTALAHTAVSFVTEGDFIGIDSGSTAVYFAHALRERFTRLTAVTHSLDVFELLRGHADFTVILCGGHFMAEENAFYGPLTVETYDRLHLQKAFIFPTGISLESGICDYQQEFYPVQKKMAAIADHIFILADSTKFEKKALLKLDEMRTDYTYITDSGLDAGTMKKYQERDLRVVF